MGDLFQIYLADAPSRSPIRSTTHDWIFLQVLQVLRKGPKSQDFGIFIRPEQREVTRSRAWLQRMLLWNAFLFLMRLSNVRGMTDTSAFSLGSDDEDGPGDAFNCSMFSFSEEAECAPSCVEEAARATPLPMHGTRPAAMSNGSYCHSDGRGKYSRADGKGAHIKWPERAFQHLTQIAESTWLLEHPCDQKCTFGGRCLKRITENDAIDCAVCTFGHTDPARVPTVTHSQATEQWFKVIRDGRILDPQSRSVTGIRFTLNPETSGVQVCSRAACQLYAASPTTWDAMVATVMAGHVNWKETQRISAREAQKWGETKKNDSCSWWLERIKRYAAPDRRPLRCHHHHTHTHTHTHTPTRKKISNVDRCS